MSEAQAAVIGALIVEPSLVPVVRGIVSPSDFTGNLAPIADSVFRRHDSGEPIDPVLVGRDTNLQQVAALCDSTFSTANVEHYAKLVADEGRKRSLKAFCHTAMHSDAEVASTIESLRDALDALTTNHGTYATFGDVVVTAASSVEQAKRNEESALKTSLPCIDCTTGGFQPGQLVGIAARPSTGKSALALQACLSSAPSPIGFFSLEMSQQQIGKRMIANKHGMNLGDLNRGDVTEDDFARMTSELGLPIYVDCDSYDISEIIARASEWKRKYGIKAIVVDHMGLVECDMYDSRLQKLGHVSRSLKKLAKRLDITVIVLLQLNRNCETEGRRPRLSDVRDCGDIEQDLDIAIFLHRESTGGHEVDISIGILKNRDGVAGWRGEHVKFFGRTQQFREYIS